MPRSAQLVQADFVALAEFRYQLRRFLRFTEEAAKSEGLTPLQYQLLLQVKGYAGHGAPTVGELAERLQMFHHGTVSLVTRCEAVGLVERIAGEIDRRQVCVRLTSEGDRAVRRIAALNRRELASMAGALSLKRLAAATA